MKYGIGNNGGTYGDDEPDEESENGPDTPITRQLKQLQAMEGTPSTMKKGGKVKKTGVIKMHEGENVIPPLRGIHIEFHRDGKGKVEGFTVHQHGLPESASESGAFLKRTKESQRFNADQHEAMMDHVHERSLGQIGS